jgi:hypothetical protein
MALIFFGPFSVLLLLVVVVVLMVLMRSMRCDAMQCSVAIIKSTLVKSPHRDSDQALRDKMSPARLVLVLLLSSSSSSS